MTSTKNINIAIVAAIALVAIALFANEFIRAHSAKAEVNFAEPTPRDEYRTFNFFTGAGTNGTATTTTATSTNGTNGGMFVVAGAKRVTLWLSHGGVATTSTGGAVYTIQATDNPSGTNWYYLSRLLGSDVSETATSSVTVQGATSTTMVGIDLDNTAIYGIRVIATELTTGGSGVQGEHSAKAAASF